MTSGEIAQLLGGSLDGDSAVTISGIAGLDDAQPGQATFLSSRRYADCLPGTQASVVLVARDWQGQAPCGIIRVRHVDQAVAKLAAVLAVSPGELVPPGIHPTAVIAPTAVIPENCAIGPYCVIADGVRLGPRTVLVSHCAIGSESMIGADCLFYPFTTIREHVSIGDRCILHAGAVIGDDGFGFEPRPDGSWSKIPQNGTVELGCDVEIGCNTCVDRARFGRTRIADGVKIDNLVQVAHNVRIGAHSVVVSQAGISGSTHVGERVMLGGQAGLVGHIRIGDKSVIGGRAMVTKSVPPGLHVSGSPAAEHRISQKRLAHLSKLPKLADKVRELEARLAAIEEQRQR